MIMEKERFGYEQKPELAALVNAIQSRLPEAQAEMCILIFDTTREAPHSFFCCPFIF